MPLVSFMRPLVVGTVFARRYKILALLGSGGMGHVYRAQHLALGTEVATELGAKGTVDEPRDAEPSASASQTIIELSRTRPTLRARIWGWLRYGSWRWKPQH